jgi:hypothetical protein
MLGHAHAEVTVRHYARAREDAAERAAELLERLAQQPRGAGLADAMRPRVPVALAWRRVYTRQPSRVYTQQPTRVSPEWCGETSGCTYATDGITGGLRNWSGRPPRRVIYRDFTPVQERRER